MPNDRGGGTAPPCQPNFTKTLLEELKEQLADAALEVRAAKHELQKAEVRVQQADSRYEELCVRVESEVQRDSLRNSGKECELGTEVLYDLTPAVRHSPFPGTIWLDAEVVEQLGLDWNTSRDDTGSYLVMTMQWNRITQYSSRCTEEDLNKPIGELIQLVVKEWRLDASLRSPVLRPGGSGRQRWIIVSDEFNPSQYRVRSYTDYERYILILMARLAKFDNAVHTKDGWSVVAQEDEDFPGIRSQGLGAWGRKLFERFDTEPDVAHYIDGTLVAGNYFGLPGYSSDFAGYQRKLDATEGVCVYRTEELKAYIAEHEKMLQEFTSGGAKLLESQD